MKSNKRGFIAISLIYSFFLVFLMLLLSVLAEYAHNRILLGDVKRETQNYLNGLSEFNPISIKDKDYVQGEEVIYADDTWLVLNDDRTKKQVTLVLKRSLNQTEIEAGLNKNGLVNVNDGNKVKMCAGYKIDNLCYYVSSDIAGYNTYYWDESIAKKITDDWLSTNALLQKAIARNTLIKLPSFSDGRISYTNEYVRIPNNSEYSKIKDTNAWTLTYHSVSNGISNININNIAVAAHNNQRTIHPVILVKKA